MKKIKRQNKKKRIKQGKKKENDTYRIRPEEQMHRGAENVIIII